MGLAPHIFSGHNGARERDGVDDCLDVARERSNFLLVPLQSPPNIVTSHVRDSEEQLAGTPVFSMLATKPRYHHLLLCLAKLAEDGRAFIVEAYVPKGRRARQLWGKISSPSRAKQSVQNTHLPFQFIWDRAGGGQFRVISPPQELIASEPSR
jgi:hypothetical protein